MNADEIKARLHAVMALRIPRRDPNESPQVRVAALEEHLLQVAYHKADLEEARYWLIEAGRSLREQWDGIQGYEAMVRGGMSRASREQIDQAKAQIKPDLWSSLEEARTLLEAITRQINRLGGTDYEAASRVYTLMTGR